MGIFIHLAVSESVTQEEWEKVYEETLQLAKKLPFAERREIEIHHEEIVCLVPISERKDDFEWFGEEEVGWGTSGDYSNLTTAEIYYLPRYLVGDKKPDANAGDALLGSVSIRTKYTWKDHKRANTYRLWGNKSQGESYHIYLLAIAALIEARLGEKAFTDGDITRGQFRKAVEIANQYLESPIEMPDRCDMDRLLKRSRSCRFMRVKSLLRFKRYIWVRKIINSEPLSVRIFLQM